MREHPVLEGRFEHAVAPGHMSEWTPVEDNHAAYNLVALLENHPFGTIIRRVIPQEVGRQTIHEWRLREPEPKAPDLTEILTTPSEMMDYLEDIKDEVDNFAGCDIDSGSDLLEHTNAVMGAVEDLLNILRDNYKEAQREWQPYLNKRKEWEERNG